MDFLHHAEIAVIELDDALGMGLHLLDVDAAAKAFAFSADQHAAHVRAHAERRDKIGQLIPAGAVERVDRGMIDHDLGDTIANLCADRHMISLGGSRGGRA